MRRFELIHDDVVEPVEEYRSGGYHPVHFGDLFYRRYEVTGKLGYGQSATVWLAFDHKHERQVSLKIVKADYSQRSKELGIFRYLSKSKLEHPGKKYVLELLDHFEPHGPNGKHMCLVFPVMLCDGDAGSLGIPFDAITTKAICRHITLGLDYIHRSGLIHCDLQPANILFSVPSATLPLIKPKFYPVKWRDGVVADTSAPKYLMSSQKARGTLNGMDISRIVAKIGDLDGATLNHMLNIEQPITPWPLRAPEVVLKEKWDASIDIWTLGCLIFQLATGEPLFKIDGCALTTGQYNEEHKRLIAEKIDVNDATFATYVRCRLPSSFSTENRRDLTSFLRGMLQIDRRRRKSTTQLLRHPWVSVIAN
ncbi:hypothetical protein FQN49_007481 [Arthroderma sp. PD_2]|nr:hypothetical protein FQN49_007481 [Arthroderma sp. PD_2]